MSLIPSLADQLAGKAVPAKPVGGKVVRPLDERAAPDPTRPRIAPFLPAGPATTTTTEGTMPKGVYNRKPSEQQAPGASTETKKPVSAGSKRRAKKASRAPRRKDGQPVGAASFVIDDRGGVEIRDGQQSIQLERADVQRLTLFLDRTKGIRA